MLDIVTCEHQLACLFFEVEYDRQSLSPFFEFPENVFFLLKLPHYQARAVEQRGLWGYPLPYLHYYRWGQPPNITLKES